MTTKFMAPHSIADEVWNFLRKQLLLRKEYPPGTFIREAELAQKLNVSRSPIREAIKELEAHGLVEAIPRKGAVVLSYSEQDVTEIYNVRLSLEMLIYEHIVKYELLKKGDLQWLLDCIERFKNISAIAEQDKEKAQLQFFDLDCEFHFYIHRLSKLNWASDLLQRTYSRMYQIQLCYICRENLDNLSEFHHKIIKNLSEGDLDALRTLSVQSYIHGRSHYLSESEEYSGLQQEDGEER